jgi:hypothetical protein
MHTIDICKAAGSVQFGRLGSEVVEKEGESDGKDHQQENQRTQEEIIPNVAHLTAGR